ncbi:MAG: NUDIX domain-containing protein [Roseivirga sp.]|nr:NUDIX domain-containing protein [Roseivirga sp.]
MERPKVGIGVILEDKDGKILIGKRKGSHAPFYSIPGGHLETGESFEEAAVKEVLEETGLEIFSPRVICVTNNLDTYKTEGKHYISVALVTDEFNGSPVVLEPDKCEGWAWVDPRDLPEPHFDASAFAIECYLKGEFYIPEQQISK